jgi:hypothetical protein
VARNVDDHHTSEVVRGYRSSTRLKMSNDIVEEVEEVLYEPVRKKKSGAKSSAAPSRKSAPESGTRGDESAKSSPAASRKSARGKGVALREVRSSLRPVP